MNIGKIIELQMLSEQLNYLQNKNNNGCNDELIKATEEAYIRVAEAIGYLYEIGLETGGEPHES